ncbi:two-component response regulator ORR26-like [Apium graveolens]|uniref:two-component response regulator ORR26-like n=1 Tax=Apium graveolens TaxID=4045 RepID=UPI003D797BF2
MDMNGISTDAGAGQDGALPHVAQHVRILLVDCDTTSLMSLASQFEQQLYKVTTTESAKIALALFQERSNYYDVVIADICMQEMPISEFVEKVHNQRMNVPIILTAEEYLTEDLAREAMANNVCYFMSKPPSHRDLLNVWIHVPRVTGEMPALSNMTNYFETENNDGGDMTNYIEMKNDDGSKGGAAGYQEQNNLHRKVKNKQIAENPNSSNQAQEEDAHNAKKPRLTWTPDHDDKFLQAINMLREHGAQPQKILSLMNVPGLTARVIGSHLQNDGQLKNSILNAEIHKTEKAVFESAEGKPP